MRKLILTSILLGSFLCGNAMAQDMGPTGIGYIPGMPIPQRSTQQVSNTNQTNKSKSVQKKTTTKEVSFDELGSFINMLSSMGENNSNASSAVQGERISKFTVAGKNTGDEARNIILDPDAQGTSDGAIDPVYKGVTPPTRMVPENNTTFTKTSGNQLSWIGFMPESTGTHRIFLQTSQPTTYERIATTSNRVEIKILNTKLAVSNNNRQLDMKYFKTPFATAKATKDGKDIRVVVELKDNTPCEIQQHDNIIDIIAAAPQ